VSLGVLAGVHPIEEMRPGGPEVIEVAVEDVPVLRDGEVLVRVEAVGLNHAETLIRSGSYVVRVPVITGVAGRFPLDRVVDAYAALEASPKGKIIVIPEES
jgi:hypothetical protein